MANYVSGLIHKKVLNPVTGEPTGAVVPLLPKTIAKNVVLNDGNNLQTKLGTLLDYKVYNNYAAYKSDYDAGLATNVLGIVTSNS